MSEASESRIASQARKASWTGNGLVAFLIGVVSYLGDRTIDAQAEALDNVADALEESRASLGELRFELRTLSDRVQRLEGIGERVRKLERSHHELELQLDDMREESSK